jgi:hypothetical protein
MGTLTSPMAQFILTKKNSKKNINMENSSGSKMQKLRPNKLMKIMKNKIKKILLYGKKQKPESRLGNLLGAMEGQDGTSSVQQWLAPF